MRLEKSVKDSGALGLGTALNAVLGLFFYLLVIRNLSVGQFGEFTLLLTIGSLAYEILDLGINASILKFAHDDDFSKTLSLAFYQRVLVSVLIIVLALLAQTMFSQNFILSALLASSLLFFSIINQAFIVKGKYLFSIIYNLLANALRLTLIVGTIYFAIISVNIALWVSFLPYFIIFLAGLIFISRKLNFKLSSTKEVSLFKKSVFSFSIWIGASQAVSALGAKIGSPLLFILSGPVQTGLYGSAQTIAGALSQFAGVLDSVFAPKLSKGDEKNHFKTLIKLSIGVSALIVLSIPFVSFFVTLVFPADYVQAIPVLQILLIGYSLFFLSIPFSTSTVYKHGKSQIHLTSSVIQLSATIVLYLILVPVYGAVGAAAAFVVINFINLIVFLVSHVFYSKKNSQ